ncbi:tRNA pseudouridine(38-40) synthase TruA [Mycetocola reblochoni]|uniref:tRNA pseudouridine synthase A n=2 Tax=Mycetocola reblochoni TaxID=331618 RepID=A0A1R4I918_9MICO|nr:tRNA pseudouridine(38-40) synthase TruA [Mycetocola reblochoni]RLP69177.1 tRNA pseudouridine(38-40) synthase TruA [Mycetocola reblochoni]SJN16345.1 tRNA pseudouridine synthase A [Mycetocola reblochoni REB411]
MTEPAASDPAPQRLRLDLAYDGTAFSGWAAQPGKRTVQGVLEAAVSRLSGDRFAPVRLVVAGRTDAGVHASGQVAQLDLPADHARALVRGRGRRGSGEPAEALHRALNGVLGRNSDVVVRSVVPAPEGFDARFSALWRRYRYRIADRGSARDPLQRHRTHWHGRALDDAALDGAARATVGLHDFLTFCKPREGATTIRTLQDFRWERDGDGVLVAELRADAFCHSMVRSLVGGVVAVGEGGRTLDELRDALAVPARRQFASAMPARGLDLVEVGYPDDDELRARAELTRARRTLSGPVHADPRR